MFASKKLFVAVATAFFAAAAFHAAAQSADAPAPRSEPIYGYRMMNDQERDEYRAQMRNTRTAEERQTLRDEHRKAMEARAKERGIALPEPRGPGAGGQRGGMGPGGGPGYGPGAGGGPGAGPRSVCPGAADCPGPGAGQGPRKP